MNTLSRIFLILLALTVTFQIYGQDSDLRSISITEEEWDLEWRRYQVLQNIDSETLSDEETSIYLASLREGILIRKVILQLASAKSLEPTELEIEQIYSSLRARVNSQEEWLLLLEEQLYTEQSFRQYLYESETTERYLDQEIRKGLFVTDQESREYYNSHPEEFVTSDGNPITYEEIKDSLTAFLMAQKSQKAVSDFMNRIRSSIVE